MLSVATDFQASKDCPAPHLRRIAEAGFSHFHWCHQWNTDHLYDSDEIARIAGWMKENGLAMTDLHASQGQDDRFMAEDANRRHAGVELVCNRVAMTEALGSDVIVLHVSSESACDLADEKYWSILSESLDAIVAFAEPRGVRIALENLGHGNWDTLRKLFAIYDESVMGLCYDSGHGNLTGDGLERLGEFRSRLISIHLHDNDASGDQHKLPFTGTIDWQGLTALIADSPYDKPINMEVGMHDTDCVATFLSKAFEIGTELTHMVDEHRTGDPGELPRAGESV